MKRKSLIFLYSFIVLTFSCNTAFSDGISKGYGTPFAATSLCNLNIGAKYHFQVSIRFRAQYSGVAIALRYYNKFNNATQAAAGKKYSSGTGGTIDISIQTDKYDDETGTHIPSGEIIAETELEEAPLLDKPKESASKFPKIEFPPVTLEKGKLYHIVFENTDLTPTDNFVSINCTINKSLSSVPPVSTQPEISNMDLQVLKRQYNTEKEPATTTSWEEMIRLTPIYEIYFENKDDEEEISQGYGYMELGFETVVRPDGKRVIVPKYIGKNEMVREVITVTGSSRQVKGLSVFLKKLATASHSLKVVLRGKTEGVMASKYISTVSKTKPDWASWDFDESISLIEGRTYYVTLLSSYDENDEYDYEIHSLRGGDEMYDFTCPSLFTDGYAQYRRNGVWTNWKTNGKNIGDQDLQLYFY